jgi:hypothetical protein
MAKASPALNNFTAGELSPRLDGRTDIVKYFQGSKKLENFTVHPHGGASRRPGTIFVREVKTSANKARLIPFEFNVEQTYILEFGNQYFRIHKDGGTVVSSGSPVEVTTVYTTSQLAELKFVQSADVMYIVHPSHPVYKITRTSDTAWTFTEAAFRRGPMQDDNITDTTLTASARTGSVTITASADTFVSTDVGRFVKLHDGFAKITAFSSATSVTAAVQENVERRTELMPSYTASTIAFHEGDPSATDLEHNDRVTDTTASFVKQGFKKGMKVTITGASTSANNQANKLIVQVTEDTMLFAPSVDVVDEAASASITISADLEADADFALGAFSVTTGFPSAIAFYEERLVFANTTAQPQTLFFSVAGDFEDFADGIDADDALIYTIGSNQVNVIRYLSSSRALIVGTSGGEFAVTASGGPEPLSPTNAQIKRQASYGSANIQPVQVGNVTLFVQRAKRKIRELVYNFDSDSYQAPDLTILAEHITVSGIDEIAHQQEPDNVVWLVLNDGRLVGMTYRREENVIAFHKHRIGGKADTGKTITAQAISFTANSTTVNTSTNRITLSSHGLATGDPVYYYAASNSIAGIDNEKIYFVIRVDANTISLASSAANASAGTAVALYSAPSSDTTQQIYQGVNIANNNIYSSTHALNTNDSIFYETSGTAIGGLAENTEYFVQKISDNEFRLATSLDFTNDIVSLTSAPTTEQSDKILVPAKIESIAVVPGDLNEDDIYIIVQRYINGSTVRQVEYFSNYDFGSDVNDAYFVDCGLTYSGAAATSITGLDHLEGETVSILADGATHPDRTVSSGGITLERAAEKIHIGLGYKSTMETMRLEAGDTEGTAQGRIKRVHGVTMRLYRSVGAKIGSAETELDIVPFRSSAQVMGTATQLFTGDKEVEFRGDFETEASIVVQQDQPLPLTVLAMYPRLTTFES